VTNESARFYVIATLWVQDRDIPRFEAYERKALSIAQRHSGRLERAVRVTKDAGGAGEGPVEVHVLSFPSDAQFALFRADPELVALSDERAQVISRTEVLFGTGAPAYTT
jgi:uncharacterized protein (DUF1330 family)